MKKQLATLMAITTLSTVPILSEEMESQNSHSLEWIADGYGTLRIHEGEEVKEIKIEGKAVEEKLYSEQEIRIEAIPDDGYEIGFFSYQKEGTGELLEIKNDQIAMHSFQPDSSGFVQISFCTKSEADNFYGISSEIAVQSVPDSAYTDIFNHNVGDTFHGRLTISDEDIYTDTFHVNYLDGDLDGFSDLFTDGSILLHCLNPGDIAPTANIPAYGLYAPIFHSYHATITSMDKQNGKVRISIYTDPLSTPYGTPLYGYNNGVRVGYQTIGRTQQYGGEIELQAPGTAITLRKETYYGRQIAGALLQISQGEKIISTFRTTDTPFTIRVQNGEYSIRELEAPKGYVLASPIRITVNSNSTSFRMTDMRVQVKKVDSETGARVEGVKLCVKDSNGKIVDSWTTDKQDYFVSNLVENGVYTLEEEQSIAGYAKAKPIPFTPAQGKDVVLTMYDVPVTIEKRDGNGKMLSGAKFKILNSKGEVVEEFVSAQKAYKPNNLTVGETYTIQETETPEGYILNTPYTFTLKEREACHLTFSNYQIFVEKKKADGKTSVSGAVLQVVDKENRVVDEWVTSDLPHAVKGLVQGESYVLHEKQSAAGYTRAQDIPFSTDSKNQTISMIDTQVSILKVDPSDTPLEGAHFIVRNADSRIIEEFDTTAEAYYLNNLEVGQTYILEETIAPDGYYFSKKKEFTVSGEENQEIVVEDPITSFRFMKVDEKNHPVKGVSLMLFDETSRKTVEEWTSGETAHEIKGKLIATHTYRLIETEIVNGVYQSTDILFDCPKYADEKQEPITVTMVDETSYISVLKTDEKGNPLSGAELGIVEAIYDEKTGAYVCETKENGEMNLLHSFVSGNTLEGEDIRTYVRTDRKYFLVELESPKGYRKAESILFSVEGKENHKQCIRMLDEREEVPKTGIHSSLNSWLVTAGLAVLTGVLLGIYRKSMKR